MIDGSLSTPFLSHQRDLLVANNTLSFSPVSFDVHIVPRYRAIKQGLPGGNNITLNGSGDSLAFLQI